MKKLSLLALVVLSAAVEAKVYTVDCRDMNRACTTEYAPTKCTYKKSLVANGSNGCMAVMKIEAALCALADTDTVKVDSKLMKCAASI